MQALTRILLILEAVAQGGSSATPVAVADRTGLALSTTVRFMRAMQDEGLLVQAESSSNYRLGPRLTTLVSRASQTVDLREAAQPILQRLCDATGETAALHQRHGDSRVCVAAAHTTKPYGRVVPLGVPIPLLGSAVGHVLLASVPATELERILTAADLDRDWEHDIRLRIETAARQGWDETLDAETGFAGVAVPVGSGPSTAAISVSGPLQRFNHDSLPEAVRLMNEAARSLASYVV